MSGELRLLRAVFTPQEYVGFLLESCYGDLGHATALAFVNAEFAQTDEDKKYWEAVIQALPTKGKYDA